MTPIEHKLFADEICPFFTRGGEMIYDFGVGVRVDCFAAVKAYGDVRDVEWSAVAGGGADFDFAFYSRLFFL